ncbi:MAG: ferredoxin family protein [Deltaproteobacteria bacterium]|nr:ferredoxin family protein [Deltaproteobacteria bacterium]
MAFRVFVDNEKCKGCEECLEVCTVNVFEMRKGKSIPVYEGECIGCRSCVEVCKEKAIAVDELKPEMSETAYLLLREILSD